MAEPKPLNPPPPRFSRRLWTGPTYGLGAAAGLEEGEPLEIYVEAFRSTYEEDWRVEQEAWRNQRSFMSRCYSVIEPEGEIGFTPAAECVEISEEEFRGALAGLRSGRWPHAREG
jgi:hypothetical protein